MITVFTELGISNRQKSEIRLDDRIYTSATTKKFISSIPSSEAKAGLSILTESRFVNPLDLKRKDRKSN